MMWIGSFSVRAWNSGTEASTQARKPFMSQEPRPIKLAVAERERERIACPALALDRHAVAVSGEADAAVTLRPDGGEQARLRAVRRGRQRRGDAMSGERVLDEGDELQIRFRAGRIEGDEPAQQLLHCRRRRRHGNSYVSEGCGASLAALPGARSAEALRRPRSRLQGLKRAITWRRIGDEPADQLARRFGDFVHRPIESRSDLPWTGA